MAEGWARHLKGNYLEPFSAGVKPKKINPNAIKVMAGAEVDISGQQSQHIDEFKDVQLDLIVTVCGHAHEICPTLPNQTRLMHVGFDDPTKLAESTQMEEETLGYYRRVRDEIRVFIETLPESAFGN
tara:strand:- start:2041 stop:2421 length:381 start_codon:yes stop_codon:yes gene_type:complete